MNMAGKGPEMLVTLTTDFGKLLDGMHRTKIRGSMHLATAIQIAGVCLRENSSFTLGADVSSSSRSSTAKTNPNGNVL